MKIAIIGAGIFGLAAAIELRVRGHEITMFEQGSVPYKNATSNDVSKGIRRTWYAGDNKTYVELVERAASGWRLWEKRFHANIYHQTGGVAILNSFEPGSPMYESVQFLQSRDPNEVEVLDAKQARARFPQFNIMNDEICIYDPWSGYIESGRAISYLGRLAREENINIIENTPVLGLEELASGVKLFTEGQARKYDRAIVATGVWIGKLLPTIGQFLQVTHQEMVLIEARRPDMFKHGTMPVWGIDPDGEGWYGFPLLREGYLKIAKEPLGETVDPDVDRQGTPSFLEQTKEFLRKRIPELSKGTVVDSRACLYASTPDDHFFIDYVPSFSRIFVSGGGSGHGFKFGASIGPVIADAIEERDNPLGNRFKLANRLVINDNTRPEESRGFAKPLSQRM